MTRYTMDYQLTVPAILRRCETLFGRREVVSELPDGSRHAYTYADMVRRARQLAVALQSLGIQPGDRVATLCWNHHRHLEAFLGVPSCGAVLHTLNLRIHPTDLAYVVNHAADQVLLVDDVLWPLLGSFRDQIGCKHLVHVSASAAAPPGALSYERLLAAADPAAFRYPDLDENQPAALCYTSGTTGKPKGVMYSHRAIALHSMGSAMADMIGLCETDTVMPLAPMFHANAWGVPFTAALVGARQVLAGPHADPPRLLHWLQSERVTVSSGVPVIWQVILHALDQAPRAHDLSALRLVLIAGSAVPRSLLEGLRERHGIGAIQLWGMTEMAPLGTVCRLPPDLEEVSKEKQYDHLVQAGRPGPFVEIRARGADGLVPWDGRTTGELEVRGAWTASTYFDSPEGAASFTDDGWFRTGDVVAIDGRGCIIIHDRAKDVIKSGGEWISSVALENALMGHPAVAEAAVVGVAHAKWAERPLAVVVLKQDHTATAAELLSFLAPHFPKWWLPDAVVFTSALPRTPAGKCLKKTLRQQYHNYLVSQGERLA